MVVKEFKGHKLCNSNWAIAFGYPEVSNGGDLIKDVASMEKEVSVPILLKLYVAYRRAADKEARNKPVDEIMDEVSVFDTDEMTKFTEIIMDLISEKAKKD